MNAALDDSAPCLRCGVPAPEHGEHHHNPSEYGPVGKGSGGQGAKVAEHPRVVLCRSCHNAIHLGEWRLQVDGDIATGREDGVQIFERGVHLDEAAEDSRFWPDQKLASDWARGETVMKVGLELQACTAYEFYRRYRGFEKWYERAAEIITQETGCYVHWRRIYEYTNLYLAFHDRWETVELLGKTLALAVAESDNIKTALEIAEAARDTGGRTGASIIREIQGKPEPEPKKCPHCGGEL